MQFVTFGIVFAAKINRPLSSLKYKGQKMSSVQSQSYTIKIHRCLKVHQMYMYMHTVSKKEQVKGQKQSNTTV